MELLENGLQPHSGVTNIVFNENTIASGITEGSIDFDTWCKRTLKPCLHVTFKKKTAHYC